MVDAFASASDLAARLNRTFTSSEQAWISTLLGDASAYLRTVIGQNVYPRQQATATLYPSAGRVDIPQHPVTSIDAVTRDGHAITYTQHPGYLLVDGDDPVRVTFTYGYETAPDELKRWACVLVSQTLLPLEAKLGLAIGGLSSVQIDDFRLAFANGGEATGMQLSARAEKQLREQFGLGHVAIVGTR